ncbi:hypothetical protein IVB22_33145 [Bradyrhizobium sp. 190]|uniref:hypothetical protein n=1 Tax=Bradyrhizobium sp. 190 TaxID=2782658 RepID=UPI001FFB1A5F|nr:hypothetical protein [Bradyrhizobium sp. 190]MCK1517267.1 hypothetical protein [Bradyrhizobium sp. 190]
MTASDLIGPAVVAAIVSGNVSTIGILISNRTANRIHSEKLKSDEALAEKKFRFDVDLAERKFRYDQELHDHKRRVEFGEELLASFYKIRDVIAAVRSPMAYGDEGASRPRNDNEGATSSKNKDNYYVPLERLNKNKDFISDFFSKRSRARAIFRGSEIDEAFRLVNEVIVAIQVSAGMLIRAVGDERRDHAFWQKREANIWDGFGDDRDELSPKIKTALGVAESVLGPALEASSRPSNPTRVNAT